MKNLEERTKAGELANPASETLERAAATEDRFAQPRESGRGRGRILVMDDEELVREAAAASLEELGYVVETAEDGETAVALYRQTLGTEAFFDLVLLDLTVPGGMGGEATLRALRAVDPQVRVVVTSGYGNDPVLTRYEEHGFSGAIAKPFRLSDVESLLERLMGATPNQ